MESQQIHYWSWYGESLAAGASPARHVTPPLPDRYFMFDDDYGVKGLHNGVGVRLAPRPLGFDAAKATSLVPAFEGADARSALTGYKEECPITAAVVFYDHLRRQHGLAPQSYIGRGHAQSGQSISDLMPGSISWNNGDLERKRAYELAAAVGKTLRVSAVHFTQGANDRNASKPARYLVKLETLANAYLGSLRNWLGEEAGRRFYIDQFSASQNNGAHDVGAGNVALAQRAADRLRQDITCVCPKYHLPYAPGPGQVHITSLSTQRLGEHHALARFMDEHTGIYPRGFRPCDTLQDRGIERDGASIFVRCHLPEAGSLFFSDGSTGRAQHMGFDYSDSSGRAHIQSVSIISPNTIHIALSEDPGKNTDRILSYALSGGPGDRDGQAGTWGNVFSASTQPSLHDPGRMLHHALLSFREPI